MRAAVYTRLSRVNQRDIELGTVTGVERQLEDAESFAARHGLTVIRVFSDHGHSAWTGKERAQFNEMIALMESGAIDVLVVWKFDRLVRNHKDYAKLHDAWKANGVRLLSVDGVDTSTLAGQQMADLQFAWAHSYSNTISHNVKRKNASLRSEGRMTGRGKRAFGYTPDRSQVIADEAELIREAAQRVLGGESVASVARDWNSRTPPVRASRGGPWGSSSLRSMLRSPHIAGMVTHEGKAVGRAVWEPIIDEVTHRRLVALFADPSRRKAPKGGVRRHALSGLAVCGKPKGDGICGCGLYAGSDGTGRLVYRCRMQPGHEGCGGVVVDGVPFTEFVLASVREALDSGAFAGVLSERHDDASEIMARLAKAEDALEDLAAMWAAGGLTRGEWESARKVHVLAREGAERALAARTHAAVIPDSGEAFMGMWADYSASRRRVLLGSMIERIVVSPAVRGWNFFDPDRISIEWRA